MNRRKLLTVITLILIVGIMFNNYYNDNYISNSDHIDIENIKTIEKIPINVKIEALYNDECKDFEDLVSNAYIIVKVKAIKQYMHEAGFSTITELETIKSYTGPTYNSAIKVIKIKDEIQLEIGKEYVLFLKKMGGEYEDEFSILGGGIQGMIEITEDRVIVFDQKIQNSILSKIDSDVITVTGLEDLLK